MLESEDGYLLIDVGYPGDYEQFTKKLKEEHGVEIEEINYLLLTHHHDDHSGFTSELLEETGATLIFHQLALKYLRKGVVERSSEPINRRVKFFVGMYEIFHEFIYPGFAPRDKDFILKGSTDDEKLLPSIGIDGVILHTPGHTEDGISIVLSDGNVFPGDNAMNHWMFNLLGIRKRPIYVQDFPLILDSWKKYIDLGGKKIFPAHGKPFPVEVLRESLEKLSGHE